MPTLPWKMAPKRSLNIFGGLGDVLDARGQRKGEAAKAQMTLEDRLAKQDDRKAQQQSRTIEDALHQAQADALKPKPPAGPKIIGFEKDEAGNGFNRYDDGTAQPVRVPGEGMLGALASKPLNLGVKKEKPPEEDKTLVPVQQPDGTVVYTERSKAIGAKVPSPNSSGSASMQKALSANEMQLAVIDDAVKELGGHESAVGMNRGLPMIGDFMDQRIDEGGVAARAQIANIGSMQIHDRTGAAMTVGEAPRLKPFVPNISDTPATIRTKLRKLREALEVENGFLRGSKTPAGPLGGGAKPPAGDPEFDALMAKYGKKP